MTDIDKYFPQEKVSLRRAIAVMIGASGVLWLAIINLVSLFGG